MRAAAAVLLTVAVLAFATWREEPAKPAPPPVWFKGNLHTHTLWSDGDDFPEMVGDWYKKQGYHFLALSEHNLLAEGDRWVAVGKRTEALRKYRARFGSDWVQVRTKKAEEVRLKPLAEFRSLLEEAGKFLLVPAEEITGSWKDKPVHMNALNLRDPIKPAKADSVAESMKVNLRATAEQSKKTGRRVLTFLNHPNYGWGVTGEDIDATEDLRFFEVYNGHPGVRNDGDAKHPSSEAMWDAVLAKRLKKGLPPLFGLATDDAHNYHKMAIGQSNPGRGWVMVQAKHLTAESIVAALEEGRFYSTSGVILDDVEAGDGKLKLKIRPVAGVKFKTTFIAEGKAVAESDSLAPEYEIKDEPYVRARVTSSRAHPNPSRKGEWEQAWTQPVLPRRKP